MGILVLIVVIVLILAWLGGRNGPKSGGHGHRRHCSCR